MKRDVRNAGTEGKSGGKSGRRKRTEKNSTEGDREALKTGCARKKKKKDSHVFTICDPRPTHRHTERGLRSRRAPVRGRPDTCSRSSGAGRCRFAAARIRCRTRTGSRGGRGRARGTRPSPGGRGGGSGEGGTAGLKQGTGLG